MADPTEITMDEVLGVALEFADALVNPPEPMAMPIAPPVFTVSPVYGAPPPRRTADQARRLLIAHLTVWQNKIRDLTSTQANLMRDMATQRDVLLGEREARKREAELNASGDRKKATKKATSTRRRR